jgi:hypothetical protein
VDRDSVLGYLQPLNSQTDWLDAIRFLDENWRPLSYQGQELFDAFPLQKHVQLSDSRWIIPQAVLDQIPL